MHVWLQISSGRGPAQCQWVVAQVLRTLLCEAQELGLAADVLDTTDGDEDHTLRSALVSLEGSNLEPFLASWEGTTQWVGKSLFRPNHKRRNWFVSIARLAQPQTPSWSMSELKIEATRASGPGGQHVNKVQTAVRITHIPTQLQVTASEERSQARNRALALARLAEHFESEKDDLQAAARKDGWRQHDALERGNAVRVYQGKKFKKRR